MEENPANQPPPPSSNPEQNTIPPGQPGTAKLPGPIKLLKDSWLIYKLRFRTILMVVLINLVYTIVSFGIVFIIISLVIGSAFSPEVLVSLFEKTSIWTLISIGFGTILFILILSFIQNWITLALTTSIVFYREGIGFKEVFRRSFKKVIPYIWTNTLFGGVVLGGFFLLIVPGLIFFIWFFLASFILIAENIGGLTGILKTREYVKGRFWGVLMRLLFLLFIYIMFQFTTSFLLTLPSYIIPPLWNILFTLATIILSFMLAPLGIIYSFLIYDNLKALKGDFVFQPSKKSKILLLLVALMPLIFIISFMFLIISVLPTIFQAQKTYKELEKINVPIPTSALSTYASPDRIWSIQYSPFRTSPPPASSTDNFVFTSIENDCPHDLTVDIVNNPNNIPLTDYVASNSAYLGTEKEETIIGGLPAIKTKTDPRVFYSVDNYHRFIILSYPQIAVGPSPSDTCIASGEYIESIIFSFRITSGLIN